MFTALMSTHQSIEVSAFLGACDAAPLMLMRCVDIVAPLAHFMATCDNAVSAGALAGTAGGAGQRHRCPGCSVAVHPRGCVRHEGVCWGTRVCGAVREPAICCQGTGVCMGGCACARCGSGGMRGLVSTCGGCAALQLAWRCMYALVRPITHD